MKFLLWLLWIGMLGIVMIALGASGRIPSGDGLAIGGSIIVGSVAISLAIIAGTKE